MFTPGGMFERLSRALRASGRCFRSVLCRQPLLRVHVRTVASRLSDFEVKMDTRRSACRARLPKHFATLHPRALQQRRRFSHVIVNSPHPRDVMPEDEDIASTRPLVQVRALMNYDSVRWSIDVTVIGHIHAPMMTTFTTDGMDTGAPFTANVFASRPGSRETHLLVPVRRYDSTHIFCPSRSRRTLTSAGM